MYKRQALQSVSEHLKEAAVIDGANILDIFKNVTWPSIAATCYSTILLMIIWTLNAFTFIYAMTEGGPAHKTEVMAMYIYKRAFMAVSYTHLDVYKRQIQTFPNLA